MYKLDYTAISEFLVFGFILGEKTMIKGRHLPQYPIPNVTLRPFSSLNDVYSALKDAVEKTLDNEPKCAITVSGGQDSRILAGIVAELGFDIPALTYYSAFESKIAARVCAKLGLKHYFAPIGYDLDYDFFGGITKVMGEFCGTKDLISIFMDLKSQQVLNKLGVKALLHGGRFNEVLGTGINSQGDINTYFKKMADHSIDEWYKTRAYRSLLKYCTKMSLDKIFLKVTVQSTLNRLTSVSYNLPNLKLPIIDSNVLSAIYSLPYSEREPTIFQRKILKRFFPKLNNIPTTTNYAPYLPSQMNNQIVKVVNLFEGFQRRRGRDRPIYTFGVDYFFERNRNLILNKLEKVSLPQNRLQQLVFLALKILSNERIYNGNFLRKVLTYCFLFDTLE